MAGNLFDDPTMSMMYRDALQSLYNGTVMPWDREILAVAPLPADVVDPFASEEMDPRQVMGFAYNSLMTWVDEAKKANYFSKHFTDLSKSSLRLLLKKDVSQFVLAWRRGGLHREPSLGTRLDLRPGVLAAPGAVGPEVGATCSSLPCSRCSHPC